MPRKELLVATAIDERPRFASTTYARLLAYIHLGLVVDVRSVNNQRPSTSTLTYTEKKPTRNSITHTAEMCTCFSHTQAYPTTEGGRPHIANFELSRRICTQRRNHDEN